MDGLADEFTVPTDETGNGLFHRRCKGDYPNQKADSNDTLVVGNILSAVRGVEAGKLGEGSGGDPRTIRRKAIHGSGYRLVTGCDVRLEAAAACRSRIGAAGAPVGPPVHFFHN